MSSERGHDGAPPVGGERAARVGERIRAELMDLLLRGQLKDPGVQGAMVHAVRVTSDLRYARIYVRLGTPDPREARKAALLSGLKRATGFIRRTLGQRLQLRYNPELQFFWDDTAERADRIETLLEEIKRESSDE